MRLFRVLPILSLLFGARASSLDSRQLDAHPLDARDVSDSDVCTILSSGSMSVEDPSLFFAFLLSGIYGQFDVPLSQQFQAFIVKW